MDIISASEAARQLGSSLPRVRRAIERSGLDVERGPGGRLRLRADHVRRLEDLLGVAPHVDGWTRVEVQVLAALARAPRGLVSARAVARAAGISPTSASAVIKRLEAQGLVRRERTMVAAGSAREVALVRPVLTSPDWHQVVPRLAQVRPPVMPSPSVPVRVPRALRHLLWNVAPMTVSPGADGPFLADRLLATLDLDGLAWGARTLRPMDWVRAARDRRVPPRERALAHNLARAALR